MNFPSTSTTRKAKDSKFELFHIRLTARLCIGFVCFIYFLSRIATIKGLIKDHSSARWINRLALVFTPLITLIVLIEYLLFKLKGRKILKYSQVIDILILLLFTADWVLGLISIFTKAQEQHETPSRGPGPGGPGGPGGPEGHGQPHDHDHGPGNGQMVLFPVTVLYEFVSFAWRALLVTLVVQKWQLKIIPPAAAIITATVYAIHLDNKFLYIYLIRGAVQLFNTVFIIYCEDKIKWRMIWTTIQQEKWMQVNNFILNNIPENIMILDVSGQVKFISDYCKSFMEKCHLSTETQELFSQVKDLHQQQCENDPPDLSRQTSCPLHLERLTTENGLLIEAHLENNIKVEVLTDVIMNFKDLVKEKNLQEKQFLMYNGKLKIENEEKERSIEIKISFVQHFENDYIILILRDTTQRDLLITLEETNKYKDQLLASVSHELRAPLNGNINLVESAINSPKIPQSIKDTLLTPALRSSKFLLHLINDILDMSQIKEKKLRLTFQNGDLKETLKSTAQLVELQASKKGVHLILELDTQLPRDFCTDYVRLSQIVLNLLNNALKFTKEGTVKLIAESLSENPNWVKITVEDSGIGMSPENLKQLFSNYTHIEFEGRQAMNPMGVGLGLNIAYSLVQLLAPKDHQTISVESIPNEGSTFSLILENRQSDSPPPVRQKEPTDALETSNISCKIPYELSEGFKPKLISKLQIHGSSSSLASKSEDEPLLDSCSCAKILVVDDNPFNTMAFEIILKSLEVKCDSVYSGSCAIKKLLQRETKKCCKDCQGYSVVFMDQEMPEMDGADTVRKIRKLQEEKLLTQDLKIIGCTAHHSKEEVEKFVEAGLDKCIHKPISASIINDIL